MSLVVIRAEMVALLHALIFSILSTPMHAQVSRWKSASATYSIDTEDSITIEGTCGYGDLHSKYSTALGGMLFDRGSSCGVCFEVSCADHPQWCLKGGPFILLTATDLCPPNYALSADDGGRCNFPRAHFQMLKAVFSLIAHPTAQIVPIHYRRATCQRDGGILFSIKGSAFVMNRATCQRDGGILFAIKGSAFVMQVLISNVGLDGEVVAVKVKGPRTGWIPMGWNWGTGSATSIWLSNPYPLRSLKLLGKTLTSYTVAPQN